MELTKIDRDDSRFGEYEDNLYQIIYIDHYGNAITGVQASDVEQSKILIAGSHEIKYARTFSEVNKSECFWYENSNGLVEIACNQASAAMQVSLSVSDRIEFK